MNPIFFPNVVAFLHKTLFFFQNLLSVVYLMPDWHLWFSPPALFSQDLVSLFKENFIKLWKKLQYSFLLTVVFNHFDSNLSASPLCSDLLPATFPLTFPLLPLKRCSASFNLKNEIPWRSRDSISARKYHIKYYVLSRWSLNVILVLYL